jgi:hypothetical protein
VVEAERPDHQPLAQDTLQVVVHSTPYSKHMAGSCHCGRWPASRPTAG